MLNIVNPIIIFLLIIIGSFILFVSIFGTKLINSGRRDKLDIIRGKYKTFMLTIGVLLLLGAFSIIISPANRIDNRWTNKQKEEMIKKIMESSIFIHGIGTDTARLVSECFINKYTSIYTPMQMREQNKMSNEDISALTRVMMIECLRKYGLPGIDTTELK